MRRRAFALSAALAVSFTLLGCVTLAPSGAIYSCVTNAWACN